MAYDYQQEAEARAEQERQKQRDHDLALFFDTVEEMGQSVNQNGGLTQQQTCRFLLNLARRFGLTNKKWPGE